MKLRVANWGFGDIIMISNILINKFPNMIYEISIDSGISTYLKDDLHKENIINLFNLLLGKNNIIWHDDNQFNTFHIYYEELVKFLENKEHKKTDNLFHMGNMKINEKYIVISTKVRDFSPIKYEKIKLKFFEKLNNTNYKILLLGESSIDYSKGEYKVIGPERVFSIYDDIYKYIDNSKLIDLTFKGGITTNFSELMRDMNLIYNAKKVIMLGWGGLFCGGILLDNFISLFSWDNTWTSLEDKVFLDENKFYNAIESI